MIQNTDRPSLDAARLSHMIDMALTHPQNKRPRFFASLVPANDRAWMRPAAMAAAVALFLFLTPVLYIKKSDDLVDDPYTEISDLLILDSLEGQS